MMEPRVAVTRPIAQEDRLVASIARRGAVPVLTPLLRVRRIPGAKWSDRLADERVYDLVAFTSANAIASVLAEFSAGSFPNATLATVGEQTAAEASRLANGRRVITPRGREDATSLLAELRTFGSWQEKRVLLPIGDRGRPTLREGLLAAGAIVDEVVVYQTVACDARVATRLEDALLNSRLDVVTFTSGSAVSALVDVIGIERARSALSSAGVVVIGATTRDDFMQHGIQVDAVATAASLDQLAMSAIEWARSKSERTDER